MKGRRGETWMEGERERPGWSWSWLLSYRIRYAGGILVVQMPKTERALDQARRYFLGAVECLCLRAAAIVALSALISWRTDRMYDTRWSIRNDCYGVCKDKSFGSDK